MTEPSKADAYCSECGAAEPDWNGLHADPGSLSNENEALLALIKGIEIALARDEDIPAAIELITKFRQGI